MPNPTSIHNFLDKRHSITPLLGWSTFIICLSALQFGYHLAELNAPADVLSCNVKKPGPLPSYNNTIWSHFHFNQCINMTEQGVTLITTMFTIGGLLASIILGTTSISTNYGRKHLCVVAALFYVLGSFLMSFSQTNWQINLGRLLNGFGAGSSLIVSPILINELAPLNHRGLLGSLMQSAVSIGIFIAQIVSYFYSNDQQWRLIFLVAGLIGSVQFVGLLTVPESPKWLTMAKNDVERATLILKGLRTDESTVDYEIHHWGNLTTTNLPDDETSLLLSDDSLLSQNPPLIPTIDFIMEKKYRKQLIAVVLIMTGQQLVGINAITYYGVKILNELFSGSNTGNLVLMLNCVFSGMNVAASIAVAPLIDRWGRKPLLMTSSTMCAICTSILAIGIPNRYDIAVVTACIGFVTGWALGLGPLPFLMISEFTGHDVVATAQSLGTVMNWSSNMFIAILFPFLTNILGIGMVFWVFVINSLVYGFGFYHYVPETKGFTHSRDVWEHFS